MRARLPGACQPTKCPRYLCSRREGGALPRRWRGLRLRGCHPSGPLTVPSGALWGASAGPLCCLCPLNPTTLRVGTLAGLQRAEVLAVLGALRAGLRGPEGAPSAFS